MKRFCPLRLLLHHIYKKIMVEVNASGPPHASNMWLWVSKGVLPVEYFSSKESSVLSVNFFENHKTVETLK